MNAALSGKQVFLGAAAALCLTACAPVVKPSDDSRYLEQVVVPRVTAWAKGSEPAFDFSGVFRARGYESVCFVPEYHPLTHIERYLDVEITKYNASSPHINVQEYRLALVVIKGDEAHAALIHGSEIDFHMVPDRPCVPAHKAQLVRVSDSEISSPGVRLGEK